MKKKYCTFIAILLIFSFYASCGSLEDLVNKGLDEINNVSNNIFGCDAGNIFDGFLGGDKKSGKTEDKKTDKKFLDEDTEGKLKEKFDTVIEVGNTISDSVEKSKEEITPEVEYYIGRSVAATILNEYKLYKDRVLTDYLNKICNTIVMNSKNPYLYKGYFVAIVDSKEINAISSPGGHIFVSKGLLECTDSEDAIAGVIAHEIAHIQLGHSRDVIKTSRGFNVATTVLSGVGTIGSKLVGKEFSEKDVASLGAVSDSIFKNLVNVGFSQVQEFNADGYALELMKDAGYNPYALVDMLEALETHTDSGKGWFKTHPKPKYRIGSVQGKLENGDYEAVNMKPRAARFKKMKSRL